MKFLKKILGLNTRLGRKEYFLFTSLTLAFMFTLLQSPPAFDMPPIISLIGLTIVLIISLVNSIKRGRDSGLRGWLTLFLFIGIPFIAVVLMEQFKINLLALLGYLFIIYLLLVPSTIKELKVMGKVEHITIWIIITLLSLVVLAAFVPCTYSSGNAKKDLTCVNMKVTANTLKMFKLDNGMYPEKEEGLEALQSNPDSNKYTNYPPSAYLERLPRDAWASKMIYVKTADGFDIISYASDRKEDEASDIYYSECEN